MCLILFSFNDVPGYRLIVAANRDEFLERPTEPLGYNLGDSPILAGKDLRGGGTWLAVDNRGRMGGITNYRDPSLQKDGAISRGEIIPAYLTSGEQAATFLAHLDDKYADYNGFNLLLLDESGLFFYSNVERKIKKLRAGVHGLSNHLLNTPWPKVEEGRTELQALLSAGGEPDLEQLFSLLTDRSVPDEKLLPDTGVGTTWEKILGPRFISSPTYGTRSSTILLIKETGEVLCEERSWHHQGGIRLAGTQKYLLDSDG